MEKVIEKLEKLTDNRRRWGNLRHKLVDIVFIGLVSVICGGSDFEHMEDTGHGKYEWLKQYLNYRMEYQTAIHFARIIPHSI